MRLPLVFIILFFLMALAVFESVLSFLFSWLLQKPVEFPFWDWVLLWISWIGNMFVDGINLLFLFIGAIFDPTQYFDDLGDALLNYAELLLSFFSILFFPLFSIFKDNPLISGVSGVLELFSFLISGMAVLFDLFFHPPKDEDEERERLKHLADRF